MGHSMSGEISAVISTAEYFSCKFCHSKVELEEDGVVAECTKCGAMMKVSSCKEMKSAKFVVKDPSSSREMTLSVFEPVLSRIVAGVSGRNLSLKLLSAPKKMYRFNDRNIVYSVQNSDLLVMGRHDHMEHSCDLLGFLYSVFITFTCIIYRVSYQLSTDRYTRTLKRGGKTA